MHRCLKIQELIAIICGFSDDADNAHMACVCRAFHDPAVGSLWRALGAGILPLVLLFPDGPDGVIKKETELSPDGKVQTTLSPRRSPTREECHRVRAYARMVRHLRVSGGHPGGKAVHASPACYRLFLNDWPSEDLDKPLFPWLHDLRCDQVGSSELGSEYSSLERAFIQRIARLLPLRRLQYYAEAASDDPTDTSTTIILPSLQSSGDSLEDIYITLDDWSSDHFEDRHAAIVNISNGVRHLHALRIATLESPLTSAALAHLAQLRQLTFLEIRLFGSDALPPGTCFDQTLLAGDSNFSALTTLHIALVHEDELDLLIKFLTNMSPARLAELEIRFNRIPPVQDLDTLCLSIARFDSLTSLKLKCNYIDYSYEFEAVEEEEDLWPIPFDTFSPLLRLASLQDFGIHALPFILRASDIKDIVRAWPNIRRLDLDEEEELVSTSVRIRDLEPLATCTHLQELHVPLCHGDTDSDDEESGSGGSEMLEHEGPDGVQIWVGPPGFVLEDDERDALWEIFPNACLERQELIDAKLYADLEDLGLLESV